MRVASQDHLAIRVFMPSTESQKPSDVRAALKAAMDQLREANVPSYALAAELLLMYTLQRDRAWLYAHPEEIYICRSSESIYGFGRPPRRR